MNYSDCSDFEINKRVAELQPYTRVIGDGKYPSISDDAVHVEQRASKYGNIDERGVDYCGNPSDAWPLIVDSRMSVIPHHSRWMACTRDFDCYHENPLRAACIVYLMMQEAKC